MEEQEAFRMNVLQLAYLGDTVWETIVRYDLLLGRLNLHHIHQQCVRRVNAGAQAALLPAITDMLHEREAEIVRRGRNAHPKHTVPKNQLPEDYAAATGFEALLGYLYLTGQNERIFEIVRKIKEQENQNG